MNKPIEFREMIRGDGGYPFNKNNDAWDEYTCSECSRAWKHYDRVFAEEPFTVACRKCGWRNVCIDPRDAQIEELQARVDMLEEFVGMVQKERRRNEELSRQSFRDWCSRRRTAGLAMGWGRVVAHQLHYNLPLTGYDK